MKSLYRNPQEVLDVLQVALNNREAGLALPLHSVPQLHLPRNEILVATSDACGRSEMFPVLSAAGWLVRSFQAVAEILAAVQEKPSAVAAIVVSKMKSNGRA